MRLLADFLPYIQIVFSVLLIAGVVLQQSAAGLGGAFGDNFSSAFHTRRGFEKTLFDSTIVIGVLFAVFALINILIYKA